jgi:predicted outer membrane protein
MMRMRSLRTFAATCTFAALPVAGFAQVGAPVVQPGQPVQQGAPGSPVTPGQTIRNGNQPVANPATDSRQLHASNASKQGDGSVQDFFVTKLMLGNKAEVELGQMAQDRAQSDDVKQFAQMLVQEHQQLNQQLAQLQAGHQKAGAQPATAAGANVQGGVRESRVAGQPSGEAPVANAPGAGNPTDQASNQIAGQPGKAGNQHRAAQHEQVPQQLTMICQQTAAKQLEMAREMLGEYEGQDFDMGFLGLQIAKHAQVVAELQSIQNVGSPEFQQLVRTAEQKTSQHLDQAKQLANKLKDNKTNP